jgi:hypothetical protein
MYLDVLDAQSGGAHRAGSISISIRATQVQHAAAWPVRG